MFIMILMKATSPNAVKKHKRLFSILKALLDLLHTICFPVHFHSVSESLSVDMLVIPYDFPLFTLTEGGRHQQSGVGHHDQNYRVPAA